MNDKSDSVPSKSLRSDRSINQTPEIEYISTDIYHLVFTGHTDLSLCIFQKRFNNKSPFQLFLRDLFSNVTETDLNRVRTNKTHKLNLNHGIRWLVILFVVYDSFMWTVSLCVYCISCTLLEVILTLKKRRPDRRREFWRLLGC